MLIGIVGGMASGKSTFARQLGWMLSAPVIVADDISHEVFKLPEVQEQLRLRWNIEKSSGDARRPHFKGITDEHGIFNRQRVGELVFNNPLELRFLQSVVGPLIKEEINSQIKRYDTGYHFAVILDIPLLFESKDWENPLWLSCDRFVFIETELVRRIRNYAHRSGLSYEKAEADLLAREKLQWDIEHKKNEALFYHKPFVEIENNGTKEEFYEKTMNYQRELYKANVGFYNEVYGIKNEP